MGIFDWLKSGKGEHGGTADPLPSMPWDQHPSIFEHIQAHIQPDKAGLSADGERLPDQAKFEDGKSIRWAAGALDGVGSHHMVGGNDQEQASVLHHHVRTYCETPTAANKLAIYNYLLEVSPLDLIDPFMQRLSQNQDANFSRLYELVHSFATQSPDRNPVKFAIAVLGGFQTGDHRQVF